MNLIIIVYIAVIGLGARMLPSAKAVPNRAIANL